MAHSAATSPPFTLRRATAADLTEIVALEYACFPPFVREFFMGCNSEADLPRVVEDLGAGITRDPHDIWIKVTDNASGKIIAASNWKVHLNSSSGAGAADLSDDKPAPWLTGERAEQAKEMFDIMNEKRHRANPAGYVHLHICFTDEAYRRRGAGHMMMEWGCDLADQLFLPGWVEASEDGSALYRTFGFYDYEKLTEPLPGVNMKRDPRVEGIEGGKAPAEEKNGDIVVVHASSKREKPTQTQTVFLPSKVSPVPAYRDQLLDVYIRNLVPTKELGELKQLDWLLNLVDLPDKPTVLNTAILSLATVNVSKKHNDNVLTQQSLALYTEGLWQLQKALWDPELMYTDGLRGPEAHQHGFAHSLFLAVRFQGILQAMDRHQPTFLTEPEWMEVPWQHEPKTIGDRLWDHIAQAPGILNIADKFDFMRPIETLSTALDAIEKCWDMDESMQGLYHILEASVPGPLYWPKLSTRSSSADDDDLGKVFPVSYEFSSLPTATWSMMYWSALTMMYNGMTLLYGVMQQIPTRRDEVLEHKGANRLLLEGMPACSSDCICGGDGCLRFFDMTKLPQLLPRVDVITVARNVCQSVEFCMQPQNLDFGRTSICTPMNVVLETIKTYDTCRREVAWGKDVMESLEPLLPFLKYFKPEHG
ncbi:hypothetical protein DV737_g198, partial [Chaetothyriales sp. CBS 132003]